MTGPKAAGDTPRYWQDYRVFLFVVFACTLITLLQFYSCTQQGRCTFAEDFEVFYKPAHQMATGSHASPYPVMQAEKWIKAPEESGTFHYSLYPPHSLMLFYPLGLFAPGTSLTLWYAVQLLVLAGALCTEYIKRVTRETPASLVLLLPFVMMSLLAAQVGVLCAGLFGLALAWRKHRPLLAGLALALLTLKPQMALMLPVLLLAERNLRVLLMAAGFTILLIAASLLFFGSGAWQDYITMLSLSPKLLAIAPQQLLTASFSPALALRMLYLPADICLMLQAVLSLCVLVLSWRAFHKADEPGKLFIIATATFILSPYSFHYDAVLLAFPCMMLLRGWRNNSLSAAQRIVLIQLSFIPIVAIKLQAMHIPYGFFVIPVSFWVAQKNPNLLAEE